MGCRSREMNTTLRKRVSVEFRFHPNGTADPSEIPTWGGYGSTEVKDVEYVSVGQYKVTLQERHERPITWHAEYHTTTQVAVNDEVKIFNITAGADAENSFYVQLYVSGTSNDPTYGATKYIGGEVVFEEINP